MNDTVSELIINWLLTPVSDFRRSRARAIIKMQEQMIRVVDARPTSEPGLFTDAEIRLLFERFKLDATDLAIVSRIASEDSLETAIAVALEMRGLYIAGVRADSPKRIRKLLRLRITRLRDEILDCQKRINQTRFDDFPEFFSRLHDEVPLRPVSDSWLPVAVGNVITQMAPDPSMIASYVPDWELVYTWFSANHMSLVHARDAAIGTAVVNRQAAGPFEPHPTPTAVGSAESRWPESAPGSPQASAPASNVAPTAGRPGQDLTPPTSAETPRDATSNGVHPLTPSASPVLLVGPGPSPNDAGPRRMVGIPPAMPPGSSPEEPLPAT